MSRRRGPQNGLAARPTFVGEARHHVRGSLVPKSSTRTQVRQAAWRTTAGRSWQLRRESCSTKPAPVSFREAACRLDRPESAQQGTPERSRRAWDRSNAGSPSHPEWYQSSTVPALEGESRERMPPPSSPNQMRWLQPVATVPFGRRADIPTRHQRAGVATRCTELTLAGPMVLGLPNGMRLSCAALMKDSIPTRGVSFSRLLDSCHTVTPNAWRAE
jgi:hypothetical protein